MPCELDISIDTTYKLPLTEKMCSEIVGATLSYFDIERPCMLSLSFVDEKVMQSLNAEWREVDRPTDVLALECERPDDPDLAPGEPCELGDVVLCPSYIESQSQEFQTSFADEMRLLLLHGLLHLLGYDHRDEEEAHAMESLLLELLALIPHDGTVSDLTLVLHRRGEDNDSGFSTPTPEL